MGVDVVIAAGGEAGGHCGDVSTLVLVPEVVRALEAAGSDIPVLGAGGIVTGWDGGGTAAGGNILAVGDPSLHEAAMRALAG